MWWVIFFTVLTLFSTKDSMLHVLAIVIILAGIGAQVIMHIDNNKRESAKLNFDKELLETVAMTYKTDVICNQLKKEKANGKNN